MVAEADDRRIFALLARGRARAARIEVTTIITRQSVPAIASSMPG